MKVYSSRDETTEILRYAQDDGGCHTCTQMAFSSMPDAFIAANRRLPGENDVEEPPYGAGK